MNNLSNKKTSFATLFGIASIMFASHVGSGFATGNQSYQYFIVNGKIGFFMPILAVAIMALVNREAITMYNNHNCSSYKELFAELYSPYPKLEILFEIYFNIMVLVAVGAVIAGAAQLLEKLNILPFGVTVVLVSLLLFFLTIFGAEFVSKISSVLSIVMLVVCFMIFIPGISAKGLNNIVSHIMSLDNPNGIPSSILAAFSYAGFCSVVLASITSSGAILKTRKDETKSMIIGFLINIIPLMISLLMLYGWSSDFIAAGETTLPTLYITSKLDNPIFFYAYNIFLFLALISTGVTTVFGFTSRFAQLDFIKKKIEKENMRNRVASAFAIIVSTLVSLAGLDAVIGYGYRYMGIFGTIVFIIPLLTIGRMKNKKFLRENPERC